MHSAPLDSNNGILFLEDFYKFFIMSCHMYKVYHKTSYNVIGIIFTKVELVNVRLTGSLNKKIFMFFLAVLIFAYFSSLIMVLLFGNYCLKMLKTLLLITSLNVLLKTVKLSVMFNRIECEFIIIKYDNTYTGFLFSISPYFVAN